MALSIRRAHYSDSRSTGEGNEKMASSISALSPRLQSSGLTHSLSLSLTLTHTVSQCENCPEVSVISCFERLQNTSEEKALVTNRKKKKTVRKFVQALEMSLNTTNCGLF